jgi:hypothetical protein
MKILLYSFSSILYCCVTFLPVIRSIRLRAEMSNIRSNNFFNCSCFSDHETCLSESMSDDSDESSIKIFHKSIILR